ncbi:DUF1822 family protein [Brasilonema sp. UFV-L1]|uniref:DUF1822 family protein n=1 Tax=Brasilonema sp. UFV-L1 TaxID=2234130 RepID=UPI00145CE8AF|nr:DUF1822 family protein [Brasilonema sp. UFV-L1]NMG06211.1 hypothetical protein [Brasilonema sp. UFV-L1]
MSNSTENLTISIPIPLKAQQTALEFAQEQPTSQKASQVYLNTLAVQVVNTYLQMLDIPTDLEASYSWNKIGRLCADVADLQVIGIGRLECRTIKTSEQTCSIPAEVWDDRIGYVIVQLDQGCKEGKILGFVPTITSSVIHITQLQSLQALVEHLHEKSQVVRLRQWLEGIYEARWETIEELSHRSSPALAFRSKRVKGVELDTPEKIRQVISQLYARQHKGDRSQLQPFEVSSPSQFTDVLVNLLQTTQDEEIRWTLAEILWTIAPHHPVTKARRILDLGMQLAGYAVALMVAILQKPDNTVAVLLRVYPIGNQRYLPPGLQLAGLYENGNPFLEVQARELDDYIQLKFSAEFGEQFSVRVTLENAMITENFLI